MSTSTLRGREAELGAIAAAVGDLALGGGTCVRFEGEPGIGKSTLLDAAVEAFGSDVRVLRACGYECEVDLPWAAVDALLAPLIAERLDARLAGPRRRALRGVLALDGAATEVDPFAAVAAVGDLVLAAAAAGPVLIVIDDAQWIDAPSARALRHASRRWLTAPIVVIEASRPAGSCLAIGPLREIGPIGRAESLELLAGAGVESAAVRERIVVEVGGRPLLLSAAAASLAGADVLDALDDRRPLPIPDSVTTYAEARLRPLGSSCRTALVIAAASPDGDLGVIGRALVAGGGSVADLDEAERAGVLRIERGRALFAHPSLRSVAYHGAGDATRRHAHLCVGAVVGDPTERWRHIALGASGPDPELANQLVRASETLARRAAPIDAARALELAAGLEIDAQRGAVRLRQAAELLVDTAAKTEAVRMLDRAEEVDATTLERVRRRALRLRLRARVGVCDDVPDELVALAEEVERHDPRLAAELLLEALPPLVRSLRLCRMPVVAQRAGRVVSGIDDPVLRLRVDVAVGAALVANGDRAGVAALDRHSELLDAVGAGDSGAFLAEVVAPVIGFLHKGPAAHDLLDRLESELRDRAAVPILISVLSARALLAHGTDLEQVVLACEEALSLADDVSEPGLGRMAEGSLVVALAMIGRADRCRQLTAGMLRSDDPARRRVALVAVGAVALGEGALDDAIAAYERLRDEHGILEGVVRWEPEWIETLVRAQRRDDARTVLDLIAERRPDVAASAPFERVRGMVVDDHELAIEHFERSIAGFQASRNEVGRGRTHLVWGERLRRARRRSAARDQLERAVEALGGAGAAIWADRAAAELAAASGVPHGGIAPDDMLTGHERRVAKIAASGASNREIANELFISPRTVETHLTAIYRKLGLRNRRQLVARAVDDLALRR